MFEGFLIRSLIEVLVIVLIFIGLLNERKLIRFENKVLRKIFKKKQKSKYVCITYKFQKNNWMYKPNRRTRDKNEKDYFFDNIPT